MEQVFAADYTFPETGSSERRGWGAEKYVTPPKILGSGLRSLGSFLGCLLVGQVDDGDDEEQHVGALGSGYTTPSSTPWVSIM
jgi:hypothetical protein